MKINFPAEQLSINPSIDKTAPRSGGASFMDFLNDAIKDANNLQVEAEQLNQAFATGMNDNLHQVMIASEKADIALQFTIQIRSKLLEAYQEIMRMQV